MKIVPRLRRTLTRLTRDTSFLALGVPLHLLMGFLLFNVFGLVWEIIGGGDSTAPVILGFAVALAALCVPALTWAQRWRFRQLLGIAVTDPGWRRPWRQIRYHCLAGVLFGGLEALVVGLLLAGAAAAPTSVWIYALPRPWRIDSTQAAYLSVAGLVVLTGVPALAAAVVRLESQVVPALLGRSREDDLAQRVEDLTESRAGAVDAADAERRRIERDLHDGAQQRLVSLALNLGIAKATLDLPPEAREVIDSAHRQAKEAIEELSDLVRGLHPSVLDELGLDAALSGLAARAPLPVRLRVDLPERVAPTVEAVAYFVVSEALTNVAKHAREATGADVTVALLGEMLRVVVEDDGLGGADPTGGSGLRGLTRRVRSVDGSLRLSSPVGGPTTMSVELPCVP
ncbi:sensor histidine kinase [Lentzea aerocolonigenes]|uniref:sensor histidine kinase n=1 Tax=Lentzea aerocolonigenes TaxID=68170 RepID=UPI0004C460D5|nr:sensor histidine kinase [Lentzea aerocolonigenes]MCP2245061.1 Signal transduction histidine kinase [Lentzea aerocolonigenes]